MDGRGQIKGGRRRREQLGERRQERCPVRRRLVGTALSAVNDGAEIRFLSPKQAARSRLNAPPALKSQLSPPPLWSTCAP